MVIRDCSRSLTQERSKESGIDRDLFFTADSSKSFCSKYSVVEIVYLALLCYRMFQWQPGHTRGNSATSYGNRRLSGVSGLPGIEHAPNTTRICSLWPIAVCRFVQNALLLKWLPCTFVPCTKRLHSTVSFDIAPVSPSTFDRRFLFYLPCP